MSINKDVILAGNAFREMDIYNHPSGWFVPAAPDDLPVKLGYFRVADNASFQAVMDMKGAALISGTVIPLGLEAVTGSGEFRSQELGSFVEDLEIFDGNIIGVSVPYYAQGKPPSCPGKTSLEIIGSVLVYSEGAVRMDFHLDLDFREIEILRSCLSTCNWRNEHSHKNNNRYE